MWFSVKREKFCQRLVASAEGPFATVSLITRLTKPTKCSEISIENFASVWIFGGLLTNSQSRPKSDGTRNFAQGGK